ncbi:LuxR C-terminal-related transcriptional regulator [Sphingomonas sp. CFBP8993]|uniref:PA1136 family autoinducer-binding transcriptional regulator n=1 Tax=Sphingomonas sp. CFBP8993 TaxID=3096526 RepID=UPI002A6B3490|nr:PA1136 family autoinducer-binding transcriptional regulator [Sphingomonas sp. CFBP8993]MDY0960469.1 LuxR C-terminal-related transcriptional regulator [Sphingomonas sp. CFBP8993]
MRGAALAGAATVVAAIEASVDEGALHDAVRAFVAPIGYDRFVIYTAPPPGDGAVDRILWIEGDWFGAGQEVSPATYLARCPVNRHVLETDQPFFWTKSGGADHETYRVVTHPHGTGLHGLQVPVFGHAGLIGAVSFGGRSIDSSIEARLALTLIGTAAFHAAERLVGPIGVKVVPQLSKREREVIRWIASGRRQADVALLLGLSERTIENHLRRIRNRLGAASTAQAVHLLMRASNLDA